MSDASLTLLGTALIVAVPSGISTLTARRIKATHKAVQVVNGTSDDAEPLGDYLRRRFHMEDGRFEITSAYLRRIADALETQGPKP